MRKSWIGCLALLLCGVAHAQLAFEQTTKDVHVPPEETRAEVDFKFKNTGKEPVTVLRAETSCSCLEAKASGGTRLENGSVRYEPGQEGVVRATFDLSNFSGDNSKPIHLHLDKEAAGQPPVVLTARVHVPVIVEITPKTVRWDQNEAPAAKTAVVKMNYEKPVRLLSAQCSNERFSVEVKTIAEGKHYELVITPKETATSGIGVIRLETDCPIERHKIQQAFVLIKKPESPVRR